MRRAWGQRRIGARVMRLDVMYWEWSGDYLDSKWDGARSGSRSGCVTVGELTKGGPIRSGLIIVVSDRSHRNVGISNREWRTRHVPHSPLALAQRHGSGPARFGPELSSIPIRMPISTTTAPPHLEGLRARGEPAGGR